MKKFVRSTRVRWYPLVVCMFQSMHAVPSATMLSLILQTSDFVYHQLFDLDKIGCFFTEMFQTLPRVQNTVRECYANGWIQTVMICVMRMKLDVLIFWLTVRHGLGRNDVTSSPLVP